MLKVGYAYEFHGCHQCVGSICMVELIPCLRERGARRIFLRCLLSLLWRLFPEAGYSSEKKAADFWHPILLRIL
jgi:hypothetical protein